MTTVKDLIKELEKLNPDAIVLYAYNEYQNTGSHNFISEDSMVAVSDDEQSFITDENDNINYLGREDYDDAISGNEDSDYHDERCSVHKVKYVPAIVLFSI